MKERIKFFQKEMNNLPYLNRHNTENKFNVSGEKTKKVEISKEVKINKELQHFLEEKPVFPCLLISKEDNGKIEMNMNCLNDIDINKIKIIKEDSFELSKREDVKDYQMIDFSNFQFDISVVHNSLNFEKKTKDIKINSGKSNLLLGKYKLYSFNIYEGDLSFKSNFIKKFEVIANDESSDKNKAKEIDEIFESQGYYIPLKIYIGGLFLNRYNKENIRGLRDSLRSLSLNSAFENKELNFGGNLNISNGREINQIFLNENTQIIGGDKTERNFEKWTETVKIFNSNIIECTNIIEAKNILPIELKNKLKIPLKIIEKKYFLRKKYFQKLNSLKDIELVKDKGYSDISKGICNESKEPEIYMKKIHLFGESSVGYTRKSISEVFDDIIVGFKIVSQRDDDYNGQWHVKFNPLLKKEINISFASQFMREEEFNIYIYLMKFPE